MELSKNTSKMIRAGLRLLEEENRIEMLKNAISEGIANGTAIGFDPEKHLESLKAARSKG